MSAASSRAKGLTSPILDFPTDKRLSNDPDIWGLVRISTSIGLFVSTSVDSRANEPRSSTRTGRRRKLRPLRAADAVSDRVRATGFGVWLINADVELERVGIGGVGLFNCRGTVTVTGGLGMGVEGEGGTLNLPLPGDAVSVPAKYELFASTSCGSEPGIKPEGVTSC